MSTNHTPNYALNQWEPGDRVLRTDFNADNAKIDAAIKAETDARAAEAAAINTALTKKGNLQVELYTYTGTGLSGVDNPCTIPFSGEAPILILIKGGGTRDLWLHSGTGETENRTSLIRVTWSTSGVSWYTYANSPEDQLNSRRTYIALLFYKLD